MKLTEVYKAGARFCAEYLRELGATLAAPHHLLPEAGTGSLGLDAAGRKSWRAPSSLSHKRVAFWLGSVVIASAIQAAIPHRVEAAASSELVVLAAVLGMWLAHAALLHPCARLLGGTAPFLATLAVALRVLATFYLLVTVVTFVVVVVAEATTHVWQNSLAADVYFPISFVLVSIYLFLGVSRIHELTGRRRWTFLFLSVVINFIFTATAFFMFVLIHFAAYG